MNEERDVTSKADESELSNPQEAQEDTFDVQPHASLAETWMSSPPNQSDELPITVEGSDGSKASGATQDFVFDADQTRAFLASANTSRTGPTMPKLVGEYTILRLLGRGGMGVVYKAKHRKLERFVALKMVLAGSHASPEQLDRFILEAKAVAHLQHPNIVQIFEVGESEGLPFFSLEFVDGQSLDRKLAGKPLPSEQAASLMETIALAMQYAHDHGILHRDLKPANILMTVSGVPKIADFGLAKRLEESSDSASTRTGTIMGTPSYMSPEQASGDIRGIAASTDQYSLGAILYEFLTGRPPFVASKPMDTILQVLHDEPIPPKRLLPKLDVDLETICLKALQKDPTNRYRSCLDFAEDLARFRRGEPILARPVGRAEVVWRWCKRNPVIATLLAASILLLAGTAGVSTYAAMSLSAKNKLIAKSNNDLKQANGLSEERRILAEEKRAEADASRKQAEESATVAKNQALRSLRTIQSMVGEVNRKLSDAPGTLPLKKAILETAKKNLDSIPPLLIDQNQTSIGATDLGFHQGMLELYYNLGDIKKAIEFAEKAKQIAEIRVKIREGSNASRRNLALSYESLANVTQEGARDMEASGKLLAEALRIRKEVIEKPKPDPEWKDEEADAYNLFLEHELSDCHVKVASNFLKVGSIEKSAIHFGEAMSIRQRIMSAWKERPDLIPTFAKFQQIPAAIAQIEALNLLGKAHLAMGEIAYRQEKLDEALHESLQGIKLAEQVSAAASSSMQSKFELSRAIGNLGDLYVHRSQFKEGKSHYDLALAITEELSASDPDRVNYLRYIGLHNYRLGCLADRLSNTKASKNYLERAVSFHRKVFEVDKSNDRRKAELMLALAREGSVDEAKRYAEDLTSRANVDSEMLVDIARCYAQCSRVDASFAEEYVSKAKMMLDQARQLGFESEFWLQNELDLAPLYPK